MEAYNRSKSYTLRVRSTSHAPDSAGNYDVVTDNFANISGLGFDVSGWRNPHWRELKANFRDAGTPYTMSASAVASFTPGRAWNKIKQAFPNKDPNASYERWEEGLLLRSGNFTFPATTLDSEVRNLARTRINRKIAEFVRPFQGGVFLGELREAIHAIRHPLLSLRRGVDTYLEIASSRARKVRVSDEAKRRAAREKILSNTWLEYVFGWRPLISDLDSLAQALAQNNYYAANRLVVRSGAKTVEFDPTSGLNAVTSATFAGNTAFHITKTSKIQLGVKCVAGIEVRRNSNAQFDRSLFGFSWEEFVPTVWELIPYSFLVDYFTNFGDVIQSYSVMPSNIVWSSETMLKKKVYTQSGIFNLAGTISNIGSSVYRGAGGTSGTLVCTVVSVNRTRNPTFRVVPEVRFPTSWTQWLNITALLENHRKARAPLT